MPDEAKCGAVFSVLGAPVLGGSSCQLSIDHAGKHDWEEKPVTLGDLIAPMPGKIAVQVDTKNEFTPGGLFIPVETARTIHEARATQGIVVAHGDDSDEDDDLESPPPRTKVGDTVLFGKYTGTKITWQPPTPEGQKERPPREEVIVMHEKDVLAILLSPEQAKNIRVKT